MYNIKKTIHFSTVKKFRIIFTEKQIDTITLTEVGGGDCNLQNLMNHTHADNNNRKYDENHVQAIIGSSYQVVIRPKVMCFERFLICEKKKHSSSTDLLTLIALNYSSVCRFVI